MGFRIQSLHIFIVSSCKFSVKSSELWDGSVIQDSGAVRRDAAPLAQCFHPVSRYSGTRQNTAIYGRHNIHGPKHLICVSSGLSSSFERTLHSGCMGAHSKLGFLTAGHIRLSYNEDPHSSRTQPV